MLKKRDRNEVRVIRHARVRKKISGTPDMPRLCVFRSNAEIYAQVIDDVKGVTVAAASTLEKSFGLVGKNNVTRIDMPENDAPIALDDVQRSIRELPMVARSLVEGTGHHIQRVFLDSPVEQFSRWPMM